MVRFARSSLPCSSRRRRFRKPNDDWTAIDVERAIFRKTIASFERNVDDADVKVTYRRDNGLDGKMSCVKIIR